MGLIERIFNHWCKKGARFLRIDSFVQNMVIYGLVPSEKFLLHLIEDVEARFQKPQFVNTEDLLTAQEKIAARKDYSQQKPYNKYFVFKINRQGKLQITHVSFEVLRLVNKSNRAVEALVQMLGRNLRQSASKQVVT